MAAKEERRRRNLFVATILSSARRASHFNLRSARSTKKRPLAVKALLLLSSVAFVIAGATAYTHQPLESPKTSKGSAPQTSKSTTNIPASTTEHKSSPPTIEDFRSVINEARGSVVKVQGYGCGDYIYEGTGFVVAPDLVATNAHVVAGVSSVRVINDDGSRTGVPILFDPVLDFAVLRVSNLARHPLALDSPGSRVSVIGMHNGEPGVVLGYPSGGDFPAKLATIKNELIVNGYDVYGQPADNLLVFELITNIAPGNSGSPFIQKDGQVVGIVSSQSDVDEGIGYAIPAGEFVAKIEQAKDIHSRVSTQACISPEG